MKNSIVNEYIMLLKRFIFIEKELDTLPSGYISKKVIKGRFQFYLQYRDKDKIVSKYIKKNQIENCYNRIQLRKQYELERNYIKDRINKLEEASLLLDKFLYYRLQIYRLSFKMDHIDLNMKKESVEFADMLNSIEGVSSSNELKTKLNRWKNDELSFLTIFEETLNRYGFLFGDK